MELVGKYYIKRKQSDQWTDVTSMWNGVRILSISGFGEVGDAVNVYNEQWVDSQVEDFYITKKSIDGNVVKDVIVRKNVDLSLTMIISRRYTQTSIDEQTIYNSIVKWMCIDGDFYIWSKYAGQSAHVICTQSFKPTSQILHRGSKSYIMVTIPLHTLDMPQAQT